MKDPKKEKQEEIGRGFFKKRRGLRRMFWVVAIGSAVFIFIKVPFIIVVRGDNGHALTASYNFSEDDFSHPRLKLLRRLERLDQVVAPGRTQFEKIVLLRKWANRQWKTQTPFYYPAWDAVEILDLARQHNNRGFCAQYAIVFLQACQSMGIHARYIDLDSHFAAQVWSDDHNRWVFMDPTNDVHYEKNTVPLRASDLCRAYWKGEGAIYKMSSDGTRMEMKHDDLKGLNSYAILPNADQLAHPISLIVNGVHRVLGHESDYHRYPLIGRDSVGFSTPELAWKGQYAKEWLPGRPLSDDPHDFSYPFNQAFIFIAKRVSQKGFVKVALFPENSPTFGKFLCCMDEMKWEPLDSNEFFWHLKPGLNHCSVRIVTRFGWLGHPSSLTVFYKPDLMASPPGQEGSSLR